jgi:hypothetical protein
MKNIPNTLVTVALAAPIALTVILIPDLAPLALTALIILILQNYNP